MEKILLSSKFLEETTDSPFTMVRSRTPVADAGWIKAIQARGAVAAGYLQG